MQIRAWTLSIRIVNILSAGGLFGLQVWYLIELLIDATVAQIIARMFLPIFLWYDSRYSAP